MNKVQKPRRKRHMMLVGVVILVGLILWMTSVDHGSRPTVFKSNGERIYFTATSASGQTINARGGNMGMGMMAGGGCVNCHGADRQGGLLLPRFWVSAPPLTAEVLFGEHEEDGHGDHEGYTDETLGRAITQGVEPDGGALDRVMPRWSMSGPDLADLIGFLKTPAVRASD
jgi:mono/diheme cytochrome c family protein